MPNMKAIINGQNKKILSPPDQNIDKACNCTRKESCPLNQNCLTKNVVYEATITSNLPDYQEKKYIGLSENTFKKRFTGHKSSFNLERYKNSTALSTEFWKVKELNGTPKVTWRIVRTAKAYNPESKRCSLCLCEKFEIANYPKNNLLNKRSEIIAKCRHRRKYQLSLHNHDVIT